MLSDIFTFGHPTYKGERGNYLTLKHLQGSRLQSCLYIRIKFPAAPRKTSLPTCPPLTPHHHISRPKPTSMASGNRPTVSEHYYSSLYIPFHYLQYITNRMKTSPCNIHEFCRMVTNVIMCHGEKQDKISEIGERGRKVHSRCYQPGRRTPAPPLPPSR